MRADNYLVIVVFAIVLICNCGERDNIVKKDNLKNDENKRQNFKLENNTSKCIIVQKM